MILKRLLDISLAGAGLLATAPLCVLIAVFIKLEDGGPILFIQNRVGKEGKPFKSYKFRSMTPSTSRYGLSVDASLEVERVTRIGHVLRATAMDEIPQLWNILKGDMSFVGPRALPPSEARETQESVERLCDVPGYRKRQSIRPGLTGLAQVYAPATLKTRHKFRYDHLYIDRRNIWLDLKLIAVSIYYSITGQWED